MSATQPASTGDPGGVTVLVLGEINLDLLIHMVPAPPTVTSIRGDAYRTTPGGRAANQAVATARLGARTLLVGRVGRDLFGPTLVGHLQSLGVETGAIVQDADGATGIMVLGIDDAGEYLPVAKVLGANMRLDAGDVARFAALLPQARAALFQFGAPDAVVTAAAQAARAAGVLTILDPTPVPQRIAPELAQAIDLVTPNQREVRLMTGLEVERVEQAPAAAQAFHAMGLVRVIVKLGALGAYCSGPEGAFHQPAFPVTPVDTVGAGDAFNGALAVALAQDRPLREAVRWGAAAGALAVTQAGAQNALPDGHALRTFLAVH